MLIFSIIVLCSVGSTAYGADNFLRHQTTCQPSAAVKKPIKCLSNTDCQPWTECRNTMCICQESVKDFQSLKCNTETLQLSVLKCHCVTFDNETQELVEGSCIENCENNNGGSEYLPLPPNVSELNQFMCEERWNRTGRLCGSCLPGHSPLAYSYDMRCVKCPQGNRNIWKYILVAFGPLTIFYFVVLFLKINATSSHLHGYLIFSQIIATPYFARNIATYLRNGHNESLLIKIVGTMYLMWNLDFFRDLYPEICLDVSTLTVLALDYVVAIYPLLLTVVSFCLMELHGRNVKAVVLLWKPFRYLFISIRRNWDSSTTVIDAFATFFILSYVKIACICTDLLLPIQAHNINNTSAKWVLYYDATVDYFGRQHLPYALLAVVFSMLIAILTLVLLLYQLKWVAVILTCLKLNRGELMDAFQGCYKDGTEPGTRDYRWFAAVPLIGRFALLLIYTTTLDCSSLPLVVIVIICIIILTSIVQPYKNNSSKNTKIDIIFWGLLATFYATNNSVSYGSLRPRTLIRAGNILRVFVGVIPLFYMICVSVYWILSRMRGVQTLISRIRAWRRGYSNIEQDFDADRLINPDRYEEESLQDPVADTETQQITQQEDT